MAHAREDGHLDRELGHQIMVEVLVLEPLHGHLPLIVQPAVHHRECALAEHLEDVERLEIDTVR